MWYLEGFTDDERGVWRTLVHRFPFFVGRRSDADLRLEARDVSNRHAELSVERGELWLRDLHSTNGSFVNGERLTEPRALADGDRIGFARQEFHLVEAAEVQYFQTTETLAVDTALIQAKLRTRGAELREMLDEGRLQVHFQPLIDLRSENGEGVVGYEALGRGLRRDQLISPAELFDLAESPLAEARLSHELRLSAVEQAAALGSTPHLFLNTHPSELKHDAGPLLDSIAELRERHPDWPLTLEIHEATIVGLETLGNLGRGLRDLRVDLAFDDFGTGQARLLELVEVEPRFLKFDRHWIHGIDGDFEQRREMVGHLVRMVKEMGITVIAEGVETPAEAGVCQDLGFDWAQGFHYARPAPAADIDTP